MRLTISDHDLYLSAGGLLFIAAVVWTVTTYL